MASPGGLPTLRRDCLISYVRTFSNPRAFAAITVHRDRQLVAALPLVTRYRAGIPWALSLPNNPWMKCGDLLVDPQRVDPSVFDELAESLLRLPGWQMDFDWVTPCANWDRLLTALERRGCQVERRHQFDAGVLSIEGVWEDYFASCSRRHRQNMRSGWKRLAALGPLTLQRYAGISDPPQLQKLMDEVIRVEQAGWKGEQGSAIGCHPPIEQFYRQIATTLDRSGLLEIHFLRSGDRPIAFDFGYVADRIWYSHKVGYDPEFARFGPGQLLMYGQLQHWFANRDVRQVDTMGILSEATAKWTRQTRPVCRYRISRPGRVDRWAWNAIRKGREVFRTALGRG